MDDGDVAKRVKTVIAFDPGMINLAVWKGFIDQAGNIHTDVWMKMDITNYATQKHARAHVQTLKGIDNINTDMAKLIHGSKGVYAMISNILAVHAWMYTDVDVVIIETQEPNNIPTRMVSTALYSFMRGKFVNENNKVQFSGNSSKMKSKIHLAGVLGIPFDPSKCVGTAKSPRAYKMTKSTSYSICKSWMLQYGDEYEKDVITTYKEKTGRMKGDDLAEAYLLGIAELLKDKLTNIQTAADRYKDDEDDCEYVNARGGGDFDREIPCNPNLYSHKPKDVPVPAKKQRKKRAAAAAVPTIPVSYDIAGFISAIGVDNVRNTESENVIRQYVTNISKS